MNETTQYHLNQWEAEDRILRQDFNRDNANLEQALLTLKTAVEAEVRARTEAVAGERSDAASALETVRAALDAARRKRPRWPLCRRRWTRCRLSDCGR